MILAPAQEPRAGVPPHGRDVLLWTAVPREAAVLQLGLVLLREIPPTAMGEADDGRILLDVMQAALTILNVDGH